MSAVPRLEILLRKLEDEGRYVGANTVSLAIEEINSLRAARQARNCANWSGGHCEVCGVAWQFYEVDAAYLCPSWTRPS